MADPRALREALAANLSSLSTEMTVSAYELGNMYVPGVFVRGPSVVFDGTFQRGDDEWTFTVIVLVAYATEVAAQMKIDEFLAGSGSKSIKSLIESDRQLGGECDDLRVIEASGPKLYAIDSAQGAATAPALGCEWTVQVIA